MTLRGHPRSLILTQTESAYGTSYWSSIVTLVLSCHVSEILELLYAESHFSISIHPYSSHNFCGVLFEVGPWCWLLQREESLGFESLGFLRKKQEESPGYLIAKLFRKNSNLCNHNPPTLQADKRTDGWHAIGIQRSSCVSSRGNEMIMKWWSSKVQYTLL